jgi:hypothetical protein
MAKRSRTTVEGRLAAFNRHKGGLLRQLRNECSRTGQPFDSDRAWRELGLLAWSYLDREVRTPIAAARCRHIAAQLRQLEQTLAGVVHGLHETHHNRDFLLAEWCKTHDDPDFLDDGFVLYERRFDAMVATTLGNLIELEAAAAGAADQLRRKNGRPAGIGVLQDEFIVALEVTYYNVTGESGGTGAGPFSRFAVKFFAALGHDVAEQTVIKAFRGLRKNYPAIGGKTQGENI